MVAIPVPNGNHYCIDTTEVTRDQYAVWLATNPATDEQDPWCATNNSFSPPLYCMAKPYVCQGLGCENHPQVCVDWCDAYAYCRGVGKRLCGRIGGGDNAYSAYYDPLGDQWYAACSSGGKNAYPYGNVYDGAVCNSINVTYGGPVTVMSMAGCRSTGPGYEGVYDMSGNVSEWEDSCEASSGWSDLCRIRGGSFACGDLASCYDQASVSRDALDYSRGFRCCSDP
jgi:formylglycine-generating enzyme required for sulfatase activity